jgi:hypothetical protein
MIRTDYVNRYHVYVDTHAAKFDAFRVELLEQTVTLCGDTVDALWRQVFPVMQEMRAKYEQRPLYHGLVFSPFVRIIALDAARESARVSLQTGMIVGQVHPGHEDRVRALGSALDAIEFLASEPASGARVLN